MLQTSRLHRMGVIATEVLHCGNMEFRVFCYCDLDFDPMTFIHEFDSYTLKISPQSKNKLFTSRKAFESYRIVCMYVYRYFRHTTHRTAHTNTYIHTYIHTYRQTDRHIQTNRATENNTTPLRGW